MSRECRERFPRHRLHTKPLVNDPGMHHGTCVTHVSWCMSRSLTRGGGENVPGIPGACATHDFAYLVIGPWALLTNQQYIRSTWEIKHHGSFLNNTWYYIWSKGQLNVNVFIWILPRKDTHWKKITFLLILTGINCMYEICNLDWCFTFMSFQSPVLISDTTSYRRTSWSLEATRFVFLEAKKPVFIQFWYRTSYFTTDMLWKKFQWTLPS